MARYELLERIGVGGMAEVFRGKAVAGRGFEKPVAIKRILPHLSQDSRFVELLITEAKTLSELRHRNIVQIYDVGLGDDGQYFLVMEFVDGLDLSDLFDHFGRRGQALPLDVALYIGAQVCEALEHAHAALDSDGKLINLVHRDVSPSNILLSKSGEVKLTDFGIAKRVEEMTGHGGVRGKFAYIAPEQAENKHVDGRSDVHSLAMVMFELLTGKRLLSHLPDFDALKMVREHKIPDLASVEPGIDAALGNVIMRALKPLPSDRYQSASEFATALRDFRYSLSSSAGDPAQALARAVRESIAPRAPLATFDDSLPPGEGTVVRIISSEGLGKWPEDELETGESDRPLSQPIDPNEAVTGGETRAQSSLGSAFESDRTQMAQKVSPRRASSAEGSTLLARPSRADLPRAPRPPAQQPRSRGGKRKRISSNEVDIDADTEWATMPAKSDDDAQDDDDFEGNAATRILDRSGPGSVASFLAERKLGSERKQRKAALPSPSRDDAHVPESVETVEDLLTLPRLGPVRERSDSLVPQTISSPSLVPTRPAGSAAVPAAVTPREPKYPSHRHSVQRVPPADGRFLGMPRYLAYWVIGIAGVTLLLIIIVLLATRPSAAPAPETTGLKSLASEVRYAFVTRQSESTNQPLESVHSTSMENPVASASAPTSDRKYL